MKIFLTADEDFISLKQKIENTIKKISGHRFVFHKEQADFSLHLGYGKDDAISPVMSQNNPILQGIGNNLANILSDNNKKYNYTKLGAVSDDKLLYLGITKLGKTYDEDLYAEYISLAIAKYFNPDFTSTPENNTKLSGDKSYSDRVFTSNSTSNSDLIFKKKF